MSNEEQIRPDVWAKINRVDIGLVMKLLRDSGADPRTQISKLPVSAFAKKALLLKYFLMMCFM